MFNQDFMNAVNKKCFFLHSSFQAIVYLSTVFLYNLLSLMYSILQIHSHRLCIAIGNCSKTIFTLEDIKSIMGVKDEPSVKAVLHWMQLQGQVSNMTVFGRTIYKLAEFGDQVTPITETDLGLYQLQQNERTLVKMLEQLEKEKQLAEEEARSYLKKGMRQMVSLCSYEFPIL